MVTHLGTSIKRGMVLPLAFQSHGRPAGQSTPEMTTRDVSVTSLVEEKLLALKLIKLTTTKTRRRKKKRKKKKKRRKKRKMTRKKIRRRRKTTTNRTTTKKMRTISPSLSTILKKFSSKFAWTLTTAQLRNQERFSKWTSILTTSR